MFRRGKEIDYAEEATLAVASLSRDFIKTLPDQLRSRLEGSLPQFEGEMRGVTRLAGVLGEGYALYKMPDDYYVAQLDPKINLLGLLRRAAPTTALRYRLRIPREMSVSYSRALDLDRFCAFVIGSPQLENFTDCYGDAARPIVLMGVIPDNVYEPVRFEYTEKQLIDPNGKRPVRQRPDAPGCLVKGGIGFLIAAVPTVNS